MTDVPVSQEAVEVTQADRITACQIADAMHDRNFTRAHELAARHRQQAERDVIARMEPVGWRPIETAPKDGLILLYGLLEPHPDAAQLYGNLDRPTRVTGYWDEIDGAWCPMGSTWEGPWFHPTHWQPLPTPPAGEA